MSRLYRPRMLLLAACLPTTFGACASSGPLPAPVRVEVPAECDRIRREVAPPTARVGEDIRVVTAKGAVMIRTANSRIRAARECLAAQRQRYQAAK